jgi:hypothetical protein
MAIAEPSIAAACATMPVMTETDLMTQAEIAVAERRSERTITRWRASDPSFPRPAELPCGGRLLFHRADYERWRERRHQQELDPRHGGGTR